MSENATKYALRSKFQDQQSVARRRYRDFLLEITSGAIEPSDVHRDLLDVQVNTAEGMWDLHAFRKSQIDEGKLREFLEDLKRPQRTPSLPWGWRSVPIVISAHGATISVADKQSAKIEDRVADVEEILDDWRSDPSGLLEKLIDPSTSRNELFEAILFAEIAKFDKPQTEQLLARLFAFVSEYRLSQDEDVKTAVGAAVRKLAMNLQDSQIEQYADLFLLTNTNTLPCEIELELAKAILWRLTTAPASLLHELPKLESRLAELALDYLKPRLILQENYASVALQAALGILLINGNYADSVLKSVKDLGLGWFTELFQRRLARLRRQLVESDDSTSTAVATNLERFESELDGAPN